MPYISSKALRQYLDRLVSDMKRFSIPGRLNYFLFKLAKETCSCYADYAAFIGELESAKLEIYRRQIAPYEDKAIERNGDVE